MFKYILVPATGAETDAPVFATALEVARLSAAHLVFLHVRADVQRSLAAISNSADVGGGADYYGTIEALERHGVERCRSAERRFHEFCEREQLAVPGQPSLNRPSAEWSLETGDEPTYLAEYGRTADLIVIGRTRELETVAMDVLEASVMATGRPVLIVPTTAPDRPMRYCCHCLEEHCRSGPGCRGGTAIH